ncbi:cytochrome C, partial [Photobacterium aphoticum]
MELSLRQLMIAAVTSLTLAGTAIAADMSDAAIAERIKPVGAVYLEGDAPAAPVVAAG